MRSRPILLLLPTPPPYAGPEVASDLLLRAISAIPDASIVHVRSNIRLDNRAKGNFNLSGLVAFARVYVRFVGALLRHRPAVACFLLSSNRVGFLRDSVLVLTAALFRCPIVGHYRGAHFDRFYDLSSPSLRTYTRFILRRLTGIIVQAAALKQMFAGLFSEERIAVLPNGLDFSDWPIPQRAVQTRIRLLFVGHVTYAKGFYDLILAYGQLRKSHPELELWFAGETFDHDMQRFRVAELLDAGQRKYFLDHAIEVNDCINAFLASPAAQSARHLGRVDGADKRAAFESADIFVLPSYTEGFSMAVLEAMAYGLPVVSTRVGALQEVLEDGIHGFLVEPGDSKALARALQRLVDDAELRQRIGLANAHHARELYDVRRVSGQLLDILRAFSAR